LLPLSAQTRSQKKEARIMRSHGNAIRGHEVIIPHLDLEPIRVWAKSTFTKERMVEAGVVAATLVATSYLGAVLYRGIHSYGIVSF
jgi:hypothetical protein